MNLINNFIQALSQMPAEMKRTLCMKEDHSLFSLRGDNSVIAINISFEQHRKASWPYRLKSNIFYFFDVFPRRRRWPEEKRYILYF